jgi:hypothetical protein
VRQFRKGEYGQCEVCTDLADRRKAGFANATMKQIYERDFALHSKIHRLCRRGGDLRDALIKKSPSLYTGSVFDWTRPFHLLWARRVVAQLKNRFVPRLCVGIHLHLGRRVRYVLVHSEAVQHGVNAMLTCLYHIHRADLLAAADSQAWYSAITMLNEMDGGCENTGKSFHGMKAWWASIPWWPHIETHRNIAKHGHGSQDQQFYTMRT